MRARACHWAEERSAGPFKVAHREGGCGGQTSSLWLHRSSRRQPGNSINVGASDDVGHRGARRRPSCSAAREAGAAALLAEGRTAFADLNLEKSHVLREGRDLHLLLWRGTAITAVFGAALAMAGLAAEVHDLGVTLPGTTAEQAMPLVRKIADLPPPSAADVAEFVANVKSGKFAELVPEALARKDWAMQNTENVKSVPAVASSLTVSS